MYRINRSDPAVLLLPTSSAVGDEWRMSPHADDERTLCGHAFEGDHDGAAYPLATRVLRDAPYRAESLELVCSPTLLDADCKTVEQMRLVNALCRFVEVAGT